MLKCNWRTSPGRKTFYYVKKLLFLLWIYDWYLWICLNTSKTYSYICLHVSSKSFIKIGSTTSILPRRSSNILSPLVHMHILNKHHYILIDWNTHLIIKYFIHMEISLFPVNGFNNYAFDTGPCFFRIAPFYKQGILKTYPNINSHEEFTCFVLYENLRWLLDIFNKSR